MRKILLFIISTAIIATLLTACNSSLTNNPGANNRKYDLNKIDSVVVDGNKKFAFDIFKKLNAEDLGESIFISPLNISQALTMAYNGAETTTKEEMGKVLGLSGLDNAIVNESFSNLTNHLEQIDKKVQLNIGNSIWIRDGEKINEEYVETIKEEFSASVEMLDFSDPEAAETINDWIQNATNGKIDQVLKAPIDELIVMYLINAIYFKGEWKTQFDPEDTRKDSFYKPGGEKQTVDMMARSKGAVEYTGNEEFQAIRLPYGKGNTSMYIILPSEGRDINDLISNMTTDKWDEIKEILVKEKNVVVRIPKFEFEYGTKSLTRSLIELGMVEAFSQSAADFSGIRGDLLIDDVLHKAYIEVNEEGTEAAAATAVSMMTKSDPEYITFIANRPFMFIINDDVMDTILFMGKLISVNE
ncbi:MAG: serpin family protein [Clostridiales bacterium]|jgi:serpin B|nr:serpin family protein [Clostridiales bacterium]